MDDVQQLVAEVKRLQREFQAADEAWFKLKEAYGQTAVNLDFELPDGEQYHFEIPISNYNMASMVSDHKAHINTRIGILRKQIADELIGEGV